MKLVRIFAILLPLLLLSSEAFSVLVNLDLRVDFGDSSGIAPGNWNTFESHLGSLELIDFESGEASGITATLDGWLGDSSFTPDGWNAGTVGWVVDEAGSDFIYIGNSTATVTLSNVPDGLYSIEVASAAGTGFPGVRDHDITVNGEFADSDYLNLGENGNDWDPFLEGVNNWLTYEFVVPSSGNIVIAVIGDDGQADLSALRVTAIPEPRTYALLLSIACGLFVWIRRRK